MLRNPAARLLAAVGGGLLTIGLLHTVLYGRGGSMLSLSSVSTLAGWVVPLISGGVIGGITWMLLEQTDPGQERHRKLLSTSTCPKCGASVISEWRMCPDCGARLVLEAPGAS